MRYSMGQVGRIAVVALEQGDRLPDSLEQLARETQISRGICLLLGGVQEPATLVTGPKDSKVRPVDPILHVLQGVHEVLGVGTLFPDDSGAPRLHLHAACGRGEATRTGCTRLGVESWKLCEAVIIEITGNSAKREFAEEEGFDLLSP